MSTTEKIKTFEDACEALKLDAEKVIPDFSFYPEEDREAMIAHAKLVIINKALNMQDDGTIWTPDWTNGKFDKYYPWFDMRSSSVGGFSYDDYDSWDTGTIVGSRLCYSSSEVAEYAGTQFKDLYEAYFVIKA
jgi:hypothetical protein